MILMYLEAAWFFWYYFLLLGSKWTSYHMCFLITSHQSWARGPLICLFIRPARTRSSKSLCISVISEISIHGFWYAWPVSKCSTASCSCQETLLLLPFHKCASVEIILVLFTSPLECKVSRQISIDSYYDNLVSYFTYVCKYIAIYYSWMFRHTRIHWWSYSQL